VARRPLQKSAGARMASTWFSHRSPMNKGELPCRGGIVETKRFFFRPKEGRRQALVCTQLIGLI